MKTNLPMIVTARVAEQDLQPFERLRQKHFPPDRNDLRAHLTMFHRLPGEHGDEIVRQLAEAAKSADPITANVRAVRHLGAGVAFAIDSPDLQNIRAALKAAFTKWLNPQDMQTWQPHITIQNKVSKAVADALYRYLAEAFRPYPIAVVGLDLWRYRNGPWQHHAAFDFRMGA